MQAQLVFAFPVDVSAHDAIHAVANHFTVGVSIMGQPANVPAHIKAAVESFNPANGEETSPAMAFAGLVNGGQGNAPAVSSADAATLPTAPVVPLATSQTTPLASSAPVPPTGNAAGAPVAHANTTNPANSVSFDSSGLAWDERIHSGNKTLTPGGEWRTKKGVDKSLVKTVELELRAKYPNAQGSQTAGTATAAAGSTATQQLAGAVAPDPAQAAAHAHAEAVRVAGPQQIDDATCAQLIAGVQYTLSPEQAEWYSVYQAKYHAAHAAFLASPPVASAPPVAPASPQATGNEAAAQPASQPTAAASLTAGAGTVAPVPTAPQGKELDATGLPHDPRINIGAPLKDAAGVWIQRHDVAPEQKLLIMAELRAALAGNAAAQASNTSDGAASTPVAPTPPAVPVVTADVAGTEFAKMMQWIVLNVNAKRIPMTAGPDAAKMLGFVDANGNGQLALMTQQKDYWPHVIMLLQGQGAV